MMVKIKRYSFHNQPLFKIGLNIRTTVFVKEQNVDPNIEHDTFEESANHYLIYFDKKPIGAARWRETNEGIKLERFAVLKEYRNKEIGAELLSQVLKDVLPLGKPIYLHAQINALRFYERYGFVLVGGSFKEAEIVHYKMVFKR